jgi:threonine synthase
MSCRGNAGARRVELATAVPYSQVSSPAKAGDPVRRGLCAQALALLGYWIARLNRAMTSSEWRISAHVHLGRNPRNVTVTLATRPFMRQQAVSQTCQNHYGALPYCRRAISIFNQINGLSLTNASLESGLTRYISTRGEAPSLSFCDVMLAGLARDGGLYVPETWPQLSHESIAGFFGRPYWEVAVEVIKPFVAGEIADAELARMANEAYATFRHPAVVPLDQVAPHQFVLELFHGPTLAFKDVAMQLIARLMDHVLAERGQRTTIVVATSGDTGGAAVEAFASRDNADLIVLFPHGRISDVQRRMMTTAGAANVHPLAIEGNFDDCQAIVKGLFNHHAFRDSVALSGVNSINWARVVAQVVYYFTSAVAIGAPQRRVDFTVPTGNFGDIFAGYVAKRMGLPIRTLRIAANVNDILPRTLKTGIYEVREVHATVSPSMDIQVSSNFERLLFEAGGRDADCVRRLMASLKQSGRFVLPDPMLAKIREDFDAGRADETETAAAIRACYREAGDLVDPHTAVALAVADRDSSDFSVPNIVLSTAHAAKFPDAVEAACGIRPHLPPWLDGLMSRREEVRIMRNDQAEVEKFILSVSRAAKQGVH